MPNEVPAPLHPNARAVLETLIDEVRMEHTDTLEADIRRIFQTYHEASGKAPTATRILNALRNHALSQSDAYGDISHAINQAKEMSTKITIKTLFKTPHVNLESLEAELIKALCEASGLFPCDIEIQIEGVDQ